MIERKAQFVPQMARGFHRQVVLTVELVRRAWNGAEYRLSRHLPQSA